MDATDLMLLKLLEADSRQQYADLGKAVHLSAPAVHARVKKLEQAGVIKGYSVKIDPAAIGKPICAFIRLSTSRVSCSDTGNLLAKLPEVEECHSTAGEDCVLVKVRTKSTEALQNLIQTIVQLPGVTRTMTTVVLSSHFERGTMPPN